MTRPLDNASASGPIGGYHAPTRDDFLSVIHMLLVEGDRPKDGYWYGVDEDGIPKYKGRKITEREVCVLADADAYTLPNPSTEVVNPAPTRACRGGCTSTPRRYGPSLDTGKYLYRCLTCNIEWWAAS